MKKIFSLLLLLSCFSASANEPINVYAESDARDLISKDELRTIITEYSAVNDCNFNIVRRKRSAAIGIKVNDNYTMAYFIVGRNQSFSTVVEAPLYRRFYKEVVENLLETYCP